MIILAIFIMGIVMLLSTMPGLILEKLGKLGKNMWANFSGYFTGDSTTAKISKKEVINLAQYMQNMGYDIQTYGLGEVKYKDDDKTLNNRNGKTREIEKIGETVDGKNYLLAYIAADENTYTKAQFNVFGSVKSAIKDIFDNDKDESEISDMTSTGDQSKATSTGMINIEGYDDSGQNNDAYIYIDRDKRQMIVYTKALEFNGLGELLSRTIANTEAIRWGDVFKYDLDNWSARYGRPKELLLAIHLSTMMPDLAYAIATEDAFNTKVNIGVEDVTLTFTVSATKDENTLTSNEIVNLFLENCLGTGNEIKDKNGEGTGQFETISGYETILNALDEEGKKKFFKQIMKQIDNGLTKSFTDLWGINFLSANDKANGDYGPWKSIAGVLGKLDVADLFGKDSDTYIYLNNSDKNIPGTNWTYNEIIELAGLAYSGNLGEEITDASGENGDIKKGITNVKWPFIRSVTSHWYYDNIDFTKNTYRAAKKATKTIDYSPEDEDSKLNADNISVKLQATLQSDQGIIYQVCEPEATGPNENIVKVFEKKYYAYDGSLLTAKKIANTKAHKKGKKSYEFNGEKYSTTSDENMLVGKQKVNFEKNKVNTFTAFSILGNVHTEAAEYIYRNLKELSVKLGLLNEDELKEELKEILLWPIQTQNQYTKWETDRDEENWGGTIKCSSDETTVLAPSDAIVEKIDGDSITLKFTTINDDTAKLYDYIYNRRASAAYNAKQDNSSDNSDADKDDSDIDKTSIAFTTINKEILTGMKITISNIEIDDSISENSKISRGQVLGKAKDNKVQIKMQNLDESLVEDLSEYFMQKHNNKYEEIMKKQMENINTLQGINIGSFGSRSSTALLAGQVIGEFNENSNYATIYNYFIKNGFSTASACGVLGNVVQESHGNPNSMPSSGNAIGVFQFTDNSKVSNMTRYKNWCAQNNKQVNDILAQCEFALLQFSSNDWGNYDGSYTDGIKTSNAISFEDFKHEADPQQAALDFVSNYERPGHDEAGASVRTKSAQEFYDKIVSTATLLDSDT